jgi:hypothetical protein
MKKIILSMVALVIASIVMVSCRKNDIIENPNDNFDNFLIKYKSPTQQFTVNGATGGTITGNKGSKIVFPPNAFVRSNNAPAAGNVTVFLNESLSKTDWLMDGVSTTSQSGIIESGGMLNLNPVDATTGEALKINPAMSSPAATTFVLAVVPRPASAGAAPMQLFLPDTASPTGGPIVSAPLAPVLSWSAVQSNRFDNLSTSYSFQLPKFGWANCDRFYSTPGPKTTLKVTPVGEAMTGATNVRVILVCRNINTMINLPPKTGFFESYLNSIPVGLVVDIVALGKAANGKLIFKAISANTVTAGQTVDITPVITNEATVAAYLNAL